MKKNNQGISTVILSIIILVLLILVSLFIYTTQSKKDKINLLTFKDPYNEVSFQYPESLKFDDESGFVPNPSTRLLARINGKLYIYAIYGEEVEKLEIGDTKVQNMEKKSISGYEVYYLKTESEEGRGFSYIILNNSESSILTGVIIQFGVKDGESSEKLEQDARLIVETFRFLNR